jgi:hypothetical protein
MPELLTAPLNILQIYNIMIISGTIRVDNVKIYLYHYHHHGRICPFLFGTKLVPSILNVSSMFCLFIRPIIDEGAPG